MFIIGNNIKYRDISCKTEKNMLQYKVVCFVSDHKTGYCPAHVNSSKNITKWKRWREHEKIR